VFGRESPANRSWAELAAVRIVFGSDEAAQQVHSLAPSRGIGITFGNRVSEAWLEPGADSDQALADLIRVFAIYGLAGCTSPRRVVLLDASGDCARFLRRRISALWPEVLKRRPEMHIASANFLAWQLALANGHDAELTRDHGAVLALGNLALPTV